MSVRNTKQKVDFDHLGESEPPADLTLSTKCEQCGAEVMMVSPETAAKLEFTGVQTIYLWMKLGTVHFRKTKNGVLICLDSLSS